VATPSTSGSPATVGANDLLQTQLSSSTISGFDAVSAYAPDLPDGLTLADGSYNSAGHAFGDAYIDNSTTTAWTATFNLNVTVNTLGYDLTTIGSISGWDSGLAGQDFTIEYSLIGSASFTSLGRFTFAADNVSHSVVLSEDVTGILASGVDAVRFTHHSGAGDARGSYRELDVFGTPTVPEPSVAMISAAALAVGVMRRRR